VLEESKKEQLASVIDDFCRLSSQQLSQAA
jgi:hypothetical protein